MISINFVNNTLLATKFIFVLLFLDAISLVAEREKPYSINNKHTIPKVFAMPKIPMPSTVIVLARKGRIINDNK